MSPDGDNRHALANWVHRYEAAWRTPGTAALAALFAPDATYRTAPYEPPYRGIEAIAQLWEAEREGADETFTLESEIVAVEGRTGVVRVEVRYGDPVDREYRDLWVVRLDDEGRCHAFEEWPFSPRDAGWFASGPPDEPVSPRDDPG
jgi:ketosteroid isomerase-like protein